MDSKPHRRQQLRLTPLLADTTPKPIDIKTVDEIDLKGTYYPSSNPDAPGILLVHMLNSNKEAWQSFALAAQEAGYAVLAIDLRGHGESKGHHNYDLMDTDIDAALNWMLNRPEISDTRLGIAGAGLGANLALRGASRYPQVKSVVLLSPGLSYQDVTTTEALSQYGQRAVMIVAADKNAYAADSARTLNSQALGQHQLQIYPGEDQGTDIYQAQAGLKPMMLAWFGSTL